MKFMEFVVREDGLLLKFEYNRELVKKIKKLQGRFFDAEEKGWVVPYYSVGELGEFVDIPYDVAKKGQEIVDKQKESLNSLKLKQPLKPFQVNALEFMIEKQKTMLCADMGLGKTCMSIAYAKYLLDNKYIKKVIVICPKTVKYHWKNEIDKFIEADVTLIASRNKAKKVSWLDSLDSEFIIMNYEQLFNDINYNNVDDILEESTLIILDEVTRIKNIKAKTSKRVKQLD